MRIQETNQILKEGKLHRLDHERHEREPSVLSRQRRWNGITGKVGRLVRRTDVQAGLSAAGIALAATAGALIKSHQKKRHGWFSFSR